VKPILEEWTGKKLRPTSLYGIRVYKRGAILATRTFENFCVAGCLYCVFMPDVDRLPLVSSCIIQVAQQLDEPWPVEVYSHDGKAYNVTMVPGDMTLYESHSVLHGRPFPLNGTMYANVFVHFIPIDHDEINEHDEALRVQQSKQTKGGLFSKLLGGKSSNIGGHEQDNHDEASLKKHMANAHRKFEGKQEENNEEVVDPNEDSARTPLHAAASLGEMDAVSDLLSSTTGVEMLNVQDANGWTPLHEAIRAGDVAVIKLMVDKGADMALKTTKGGTALWWARRLGSSPELIEFLESVGALEEGEDL
jgi:hypothetical protein